MESTKKAYAAWVAVCLLWGTTYLAIRIALETIPPLFMAGFRYLVAGAVLVAILKLKGERLPPPRLWTHLAVLGVLLLGLGNGGVVWAEQTVPSGLTAVLVATTPFWMVGIDAAMPDGHRLTARRVFGLVLGFAGIVVLVWPEIRSTQAGGGFLEGVVSAQIASAGWALGSSYARRRHQDENVLIAAAFQMLFGGLVLVLGGALRQEWRLLTLNPHTFAAWVYLVLFGGIGGFSAYAYALKHLPVATVSLYAYVNPIIAVALGSLVLNEPFNPRLAAAAAAVLTGAWLVRARA